MNPWKFFLILVIGFAAFVWAAVKFINPTEEWTVDLTVVKADISSRGGTPFKRGEVKHRVVGYIPSVDVADEDGRAFIIVEDVPENEWKTLIRDQVIKIKISQRKFQFNYSWQGRVP